MFDKVRHRKIRFVLLLATLLISGSLIPHFISYYTAHKSIATQIAKTTLPLTSDNIYSEIQRDLLRPIFISSMMAKDTFVRDWVINGEIDEAAIVRYLKEIQDYYGTVTSFFVSESTRNYYHSSGILKQVDKSDQQDAWYFQMQKSDNDYDINVDTDTANATSLTIFINYRVYDYTGKYIGVIGVGLAVKAVKRLMKDYKARYNREVYFTDENGLVTLRDIDNNIAGTLQEAVGTSYSDEILNSQSNSLTYKHKGITHFLNSRFVPEFNWYLIVEQHENEAEMVIQRTLMANIAISLSISIIILILVHLLINGYQRKLENMATTDKLTGVANRNLFEILFEQAQYQSKHNNTPLSAIMLDIDWFKKINDQYGHQAGDLVLKNIAQTVKKNIRDADILFRWGGEEFLIILPKCNNTNATKIAEKIRAKVQELENIYSSTSISVTVSMGVATMVGGVNSEKILSCADKALYLAKKNGRNRVEQFIDNIIVNSK